MENHAQGGGVRYRQSYTDLRHHRACPGDLG
jgi:hypothetical protein